MIFGSVCSGIEAASCAWHPLGWQTAFVAEIEKFPCAVLAHHYPTVPNYGDVTKFKEWPDARIDVLVGGTPCQSFSVAGLRKGLDDPRGNLTLTYLAVAEKYRPQWLVWENVPGVLSDRTGAFGAFLGGLAELGYGFAYRILDAQYFGVAQRRRRVFVVGYFGDWRRAAAVLFERASLQGHPTPRRETRQSVAPTISARTKGGGGLGTDFDCDGGLIESYCPEFVSQAMSSKWTKGSSGPAGDEVANLVTHSLRVERFDASEDGTGRGTPLVPTFLHVNKGRPDGRKSAHTEMVTLETETIPTLATDGHAQSAIAFSSKDHGADAGEVSPTLRSMGHAESHPNGGGQVAVCFDTTQITSPSNVSNPKADDPCHPLASGAHPPAIAFQASQSGMRTHDTHATLDSNNGSRRHHGVLNAMQVRRLTAKECERLQGFPDDYTLVIHRKKPAADGPRYKALGNSMAVPVMRWIGLRIAAVSEACNPGAESAQ